MAADGDPHREADVSQRANPFEVVRGLLSAGGMPRTGLSLVVPITAAALTLFIDRARADEPPAVPAPAPTAAAPAAAPRPAGMLLRRGKLALAVNLEIEMSAGKAGKPLSIAPDLSYGVTDDLTVAVVHSRFAMTGFRAAAGGGLCVAGTDGGCVALYNNVGGEGWFQIARGPLATAIGGGLHVTNLDAGHVAVKVGAKLRHAHGALALHAQPSVLLAVTERTDDAGEPINRDTLWLPVQATYRRGRVTVGLGSGLKGPLQGFADRWQVPLGFMAQAAIDRSLTVGASWVFGALVGGAPEPATGPDARGAQAWIGYTR